jgi:hypothetical protein
MEARVGGLEDGCREVEPAADNAESPGSPPRGQGAAEGWFGPGFWIGAGIAALCAVMFLAARATVAGQIDLISIGVVVGVVVLAGVLGAIWWWVRGRRAFPMTGAARSAAIPMAVIAVFGTYGSLKTAAIGSPVPRTTSAPVDPSTALRISGPFQLGPLDASIESSMRSAVGQIRPRSMALRAVLLHGDVVAVFVVADMGITGIDGANMLTSLVSDAAGADVPGHLEIVGDRVVARARSQGLDLAMWAEPPLLLLMYAPDAGQVVPLIEAVR